MTTIDKPGTATVKGWLSHVSGLGGESTGWQLDLDEPLTAYARSIDQLEIEYDGAFQLREGQHVEASGELSSRDGIETGTSIVLNVDRIREIL